MALSYSTRNKRNAAFIETCNAMSVDDFGGSHEVRDAILALRPFFQGEIIFPSNKDYDADRMLSNPVFQFHPIVILYCKTEVDAALALGLCRDQGLPFSVRSGGHCTAGFSGNNGVMIDVKNLNGILIDEDAKTAVCGTGVEFGDFQQALDPYHLNVPGGECADVCVGGYVQGGGFGFTAAKYGISCDNVIEVRVLLADGTVAVSNKDKNPELLWAVCGGTGGNFGILLTVKFQLHDLDKCYGFALDWALDTDQEVEQAAQALCYLQNDYMLNSVAGPDLTLQLHIGFQYVDDSKTKMKPFLMVRGLWAGDVGQGPDVIAPLKALPGMLRDHFWEAVDTFYVMNHKLLHYPQGMPPMPPGPDPLEDKSSHYVTRDLALGEWQQMLGFMKTSLPNKSFAYMEVYGGAIAERDRLSNAFVHRDAAFNLILDVFWKDD
ncbi:MAG: FAD-binding oxidoreductase [Rhodobacteraceae bacterium]|nr:FAD-binding oxidoreductase [Paracoccaceae bacterium]